MLVPQHAPANLERLGLRDIGLVEQPQLALGVGNGLQQAGLDSAGVVGQLAAGLGMVPPGSRLSAQELLADLTQKASMHPFLKEGFGIEIGKTNHTDLNGF